MLKRYPHTATLIAEVKTLAPTDPDDGITGRDKENETEYEIQGRYEDTSGTDSPYKGKFYARSNPMYNYIGSDNGKLIFAGRTYDVKLLIPFQTHVEIWLA